MSEENNNNNGDYKPMTDEQRQRMMDFILEHQAKFSVDIDKLNEAHDKAIIRLDRLERIMKMALVAGRRVRSEFRQSQSDIKELREQGYEQDKRITVIIDTNHELQEIARENLAAIREMRNKQQESDSKIQESGTTIQELRELSRENLEAIRELRKNQQESDSKLNRLSDLIEKHVTDKNAHNLNGDGSTKAD
jgi:uncharacterized coiled-coil DUF342 family protein